MPEIIEFNLDDDDYYAIDIAWNTAYRFLKYPHIKPRQVIGLGNALYALERLPLVTEGVCCEFGLTYRSGTEEFNEMRYINFRISEDTFEISEGGSVYDENVGSDNYSNSIWYIEVGGYRESKCEPSDIENIIVECINLGAEVIVNNDESCIDYKEESNNYKLEDKHMAYKDKIIEYVAKEACKKVSTKIIRKLQQMTECMLSGDDSELGNVWDEICVQIQWEESTMWDVYLDTIRSFIQHEMNKINVKIKQAIWLQTEEGLDWEFDDEQGSLEFCEDDITEYILQDYILQSAVDWSNKRIEKYLERQYYFD